MLYTVMRNVKHMRELMKGMPDNADISHEVHLRKGTITCGQLRNEMEGKDDTDIVWPNDGFSWILILPCEPQLTM